MHAVSLLLGAFPHPLSTSRAVTNREGEQMNIILTSPHAFVTSSTCYRERWEKITQGFCSKSKAIFGLCLFLPLAYPQGNTIRCRRVVLAAGRDQFTPEKTQEVLLPIQICLAFDSDSGWSQIQSEKNP